MRALLFGASGQIGSELCIELSAQCEVIPTTKETFDLLETKNINAYLTTHNPDIVINASAYTNVEVAERQVNVADRLNHLAPREMARYCAKTETPLIHISTDYVFDGTKDSPYVETDATCPINQYGKTKLDGEKAVIAEMLGRKDPFKNWAIFRTSWIYGVNARPNFLNTIKRISKTNPELKIVHDQLGCPTWSRLVAIGISQYVAAQIIHAGCPAASPPIYHMCCSGTCSWYDFASAIVALTGLDTKVIPITTDQFPTAATRPKNSVLNCDLLKKRHMIFLPHWESALRLCLGE